MDSSNAKKKFARMGIATKGVVYLLAGILTTMAALGQGGQKTGSKGVFSFIQGQAFGQVLLAIIALGLAGYVFWRLYQAIADPENHGEDPKGTALRISYAISAVIYGTLTFTAIKMLTGSGSSGGSSKQSLIASILEKSYGPIVVGIIAACLFGKAIYQFYRAYTGKYKNKIKIHQLDHRARNLVLKAGKFGYAARGVVITIVSYFFLRAAIESNASQVKGKEGAFDFIQQSDWGSILLALVAIGLAGYGFFMIVKARYRDMSAVR